MPQCTVAGDANVFERLYLFTSYDNSVSSLDKVILTQFSTRHDVLAE